MARARSVSASSVLLGGACVALASSFLPPIVHGYGPSSTQLFPLDRGIVIGSVNTDHVIVASIGLAMLAVMRRHSLIETAASLALAALATLYFGSLIWIPALWGTLPRAGFVPAAGFWLLALGTALLSMAMVQRASESRHRDRQGRDGILASAPS